jgi:N-carbamoylputrescine amidase
MRISLIQRNSRANRLEENVERPCGFVVRAAGDKAELVVLPEFFNREYFPQYRDYKYMDYAEADDGYTQSRMKQAARDHGICLVSTILEMERPGLYFDTAMLINREGQIAGKYRKVHPAALLSLEKIYFRGGSTFPVFQLDGGLSVFRPVTTTCFRNRAAAWPCVAPNSSLRRMPPPSMIPGRTF